MALTDGSGLGPENRVSCGALLSAWERAGQLVTEGMLLGDGDVLGEIGDSPPVAAIGSARVLTDALAALAEVADPIALDELLP